VKSASCGHFGSGGHSPRRCVTCAKCSVTLIRSARIVSPSTESALPSHSRFLSLFRDRRFRLTGRRLKPDSNHAMSVPVESCSGRETSKPSFSFSTNGSRLHRLDIVLLAFFSNVTLVGRGNSDASVTSSGGNADFICFGVFHPCASTSFWQTLAYARLRLGWVLTGNDPRGMRTVKTTAKILKLRIPPCGFIDSSWEFSLIENQHVCDGQQNARLILAGNSTLIARGTAGTVRPVLSSIDRRWS